MDKEEKKLALSQPDRIQEDLLTMNEQTNKQKQRETITKLKLLHNELEHNYVLLLKNLSKSILKPKDLLRKHESNEIFKKIK